MGMLPMRKARENVLMQKRYLGEPLSRQIQTHHETVQGLSVRKARSQRVLIAAPNARIAHRERRLWFEAIAPLTAAQLMQQAVRSSRRGVALARVR